MRSWMDIKEETLVSKIGLLKEQIDACTDKFVRRDLITTRAKYIRELYRVIERKERYLRYENNLR